MTGFSHLSLPSLESTFDEYLDDRSVLKSLHEELMSRARLGYFFGSSLSDEGNRLFQLTEDVLERIYELYDQDLRAYEERLATISVIASSELAKPAETPLKPSLDFETLVRERRRLSIQKVDGNWRSVGLLRASGYSVGLSSEISSSERHRILNYIFLEDQLVEVDDLDYAAEWGEVKTGDRLKKIVNSLTSFTKNAKRHRGSNFEQAISDWESDLSYLKDKFYDKWGDFPWPDTQL